jgi:DNA polymerase-3 subunit gamma/tau
MRDAQSMLDRLISFTEGNVTLESAQKIFGAVDRTILWQLSSAVFARDTQTVFTVLDDVFSQSIDIRGFLNDFIAHWRNLLIVVASKHGTEKDSTGIKLRSLLEVTEAELAVLTQQTGESDQFTISRYFDLAADIAQKALNSYFPRYILEAGLVKMCALQELRPVADIIKSLSAAPVTAQLSAPSGAAPRAPLTGTAPQQTVSAPRAELSWPELVEYISKTKRAAVLASHLKRSALKKFTAGELVIESSQFDTAALSEKAVIAQLKVILAEYSGVPTWTIKVHTVGDNTHPESLDAVAKQASLERSMQLKQEAENDPLVQSALKIFEGSKIDRVIELK